MPALAPPAVCRTGLPDHAMSRFARFSSPSVHEPIMASARCECKRPMHVHPHVFQFVTRKPRFPPENVLPWACRTVFDGDCGADFVLTNQDCLTGSVLRSVTGDPDARDLM
jgi:hypothetical protein